MQEVLFKNPRAVSQETI